MVQSLQGLWEQNYDSLSEGQKKVVNLSVVIIQASRLGVKYVILDEMDAHLDTRAREDMLRSFLATPWTFVFTTHSVVTSDCHQVKLYMVNNGGVHTDRLLTLCCMLVPLYTKWDTTSEAASQNSKASTILH